MMQYPSHLPSKLMVALNNMVFKLMVFMLISNLLIESINAAWCKLKLRACIIGPTITR